MRKVTARGKWCKIKDAEHLTITPTKCYDESFIMIKSGQTRARRLTNEG